MGSDELAAAVLVSLLKQGHRADTLECLTHGDGRGTVPPNTLVNALTPIAAQLAEARESERAAMTEVNGLKDALAQVPEFICRKCGRRQDGPTDNDARF